MPRRNSPQQLIPLIGTDRCPLFIDVRRAAAFASSPIRIAGAIWRDHMKTDEWLPRLPDRRPVVIYCTHGHNVSEIAAARLAASGVDVAMLDGGIEAWVAAGGVTVARAAPGLDAGLPEPSVWVTRERPKIDRIACPWLIRRFIDPFAVFHFVAAEWVKDVAEETGWIPFDIKDVLYSHRGEKCTFDTLISEFGLTDPALLHLARNRARRRHSAFGYRAAGGGASRDLARPFGRSKQDDLRADGKGHDHLRCALWLVPICNRRDPQLAGQGGMTMTSIEKAVPNTPVAPSAPPSFDEATVFSRKSVCCRSAALPGRSH